MHYKNSNKTTDYTSLVSIGYDIYRKKSFYHATLFAMPATVKYLWTNKLCTLLINFKKIIYTLIKERELIYNLGDWKSECFWSRTHFKVLPYNAVDMAIFEFYCPFYPRWPFFFITLRCLNLIIKTVKIDRKKILHRLVFIIFYLLKK